MDRLREIRPEVRREILKWIIQSALGLPGYGVILFLTAGPYRYVRHPGYVGAILSQSATPFLLGSWWAYIPSVISAALYIVRTFLEDRTLFEELAGYEEFAQQTRYRLLPGVW